MNRTARADGRDPAGEPDDGFRAREWRWLAMFTALTLLVPLIGFAIYSLEVPRVEQDALGDMEAIARLKAEQIESWLAERQGNAVSVAASPGFGAHIDELVRDKSNAALSKLIRNRFAVLRAAYGFYNILLLDTEGRRLIALDEQAEVSPPLKALLRRSLASKAVQASDLYHDAAGRARLDWVSPVVVSGPRGERVVAAIVLRVAPERFLFPMLQNWPTASPSAETLLARREGESVVLLHDLRHDRGIGPARRVAKEDRDPLTVAALDAPGAGTVRGRDYRGTTVLAAIRPIAGSRWRVVAKIDQEEMLAPLRQLALWVSAVAFAALAALSGAFLLLLRQQRRTQTLALLVREAHADRVLRNFFDLSFIGIGITSPGTKRWLKFNDRLCAILGRTRDELAEINWMDVTHPEDRDRNSALFDSVMRGESEGYTVDKRFIRKDGTVVHTTVDVKCVRNPDGTPELLLATVLDITARMQAAQTVRESEARFRALTEMSSDFYWESDAEHRLTRSGSAGKASTVSIFQRGAQIGERRREIPRLSPGEAGWRAPPAILDAHLPFRNLELSHVGADGTGRNVVSVSGDPVFDGGGAFIGYRGVGTDVTDRKRAEDALRQLSSALEQSPLSILITDVKGRIEYVNPYFEQVTGYRSDEILGRNPRVLSSGTTPRETYQELWATITAGRIWRGEFWNKGKSGELFLERASIAPIVDETGRCTHFVAVKDDITALRQAEQMRDSLEAQLRQSQKMEALGTLAGGVAHDFNNVIATILGNVELARQDLGERHTARESLEEIAKASRRAKDLVQQILAFGRRQTVSREVISLEPVVEEAARLLRATVPAGVTLNVYCGEGTPDVLADASQVHQVIINLGTNAWHAVQGLDRAGEIEFRLERRVHAAGGEPGHLPPGTYACLSVRDNGPGIDEKLRERVFEPFFTTKPVGQGTGLGLSVVHGIVHKHDAHIMVESAPGEGAAFWIYFPAAETAEAAAGAQDKPVGRRQDAAAPAPHGPSRHVLYVDDDESIVFLMKRLLERQGYRVSGYTDPRKALEAVRTAPAAFDLAVTDYNMPAMSGLELARALRELRADLPVALATGLITDELRAKAPAAGVSELIYKPNTVDELCDTIARLAYGLPG